MLRYSCQRFAKSVISRGYRVGLALAVRSWQAVGDVREDGQRRRQPFSRSQWQFWAQLLSVLLISISPSLSNNDAAWEAGAINAAVTGVLLFVLAVFNVERHAYWTDSCQIGIGLSLMGSPCVLGYRMPEFAL